MQTAASPPLFKSFILGGFECSNHVNRDGLRLDLIASTQHDVSALSHYRNLKEIGIFTARDGIRWHLIDQGGRYDFSSLEPMTDAAKEAGIQIIWDLCHYGWPSTVDPLHRDFIPRFADYAAAVGKFFSSRVEDTQYFTPINEVSFLTWAIGVGYMHPYISGRDWELKCQFVQATMRAMDALRAELPGVRFLQGEPCINILPREGAGPEEIATAIQWHNGQFETWDLLCGNNPEVGGSPNYLDIVGVNFYHSNQWIHNGPRLVWNVDSPDPRWRPLHDFLIENYQRYGRPVVMSETSHFGSGRVAWFREILDEVEKALSAGVPVKGVCLYPIVDRHDWDDCSHWHRSGVWDVSIAPDGTMTWELEEAYAAEIRAAANRFEERAPTHLAVEVHEY